jgi:hypothetical protein
VRARRKPRYSSPAWSRESKEGSGWRARRRLGSQGHGGGSRLARASPGIAGPRRWRDKAWRSIGVCTARPR